MAATPGDSPPPWKVRFRVTCSPAEAVLPIAALITSLYARLADIGPSRQIDGLVLGFVVSLADGHVVKDGLPMARPVSEDVTTPSVIAVVLQTQRLYAAVPPGCSFAAAANWTCMHRTPEPPLCDGDSDRPGVVDGLPEGADGPLAVGPLGLALEDAPLGDVLPVGDGVPLAGLGAGLGLADNEGEIEGDADTGEELVACGEPPLEAGAVGPQTVTGADAAAGPALAKVSARTPAAIPVARTILISTNDLSLSVRPGPCSRRRRDHPRSFVRRFPDAGRRFACVPRVGRWPITG